MLLKLRCSDHLSEPSTTTFVVQLDAFPSSMAYHKFTSQLFPTDCLICLVPNLPTVKAPMLPPDTTTRPHPQLQAVLYLHCHPGNSPWRILSILWRCLTVHQGPHIACYSGCWAIPGVGHTPSREVLPHHHRDYRTAQVLCRHHLEGPFTDGTAMASPALVTSTTFSNLPKFWKRYVEDICCAFATYISSTNTSL